MSPSKILVLAYVVSPHRGSEYSVAWNFITHMSRTHELTVLFGASGLHMGDTAELENHVAKHPLPNVRFVPVRPNGLANLLNSANRRGWFNYTFYFGYRLWHFQAYKLAQELLESQKFDLVHYLGPIGYREPGYLWRLGMPYVWGPIGGAVNVPFQMFPALPATAKAKFAFRTVVNWFQLRFSRRVHRALDSTDVLLTATTENQEIFRRVLGRVSLYLPENGIVGEISLDGTKFDNLDRIHLVWIGCVEARKALVVLVEALTHCAQRERFLVHVVGDGPLRPKLEARVREAGLSGTFIWHGHVTRGKVQALLSKSHLHVVTSVSEGNPTTIWEAMSCGVPTLSVDHCGMHDTVRPDSGIKVPLSDYNMLVREFALRLDEVAANPACLRDMAQCVVQHAPSHHWNRRAAFFAERYEEAMRTWQRRQPSTGHGLERAE